MKGEFLPKICTLGRAGLCDILAPLQLMASLAVVKGVRTSLSVYILLTLGQTLRDAEFSDYLVYNLHSITFFNSLQHFLIALRCTELSAVTENLTLKTMEILLGAEGK